MEMRLQKYLALCQIASRRKAEVLISEGKIKVNGTIVTALGTKINPALDKVYYEDELIQLSKEPIYIMLHKPENYITTVSDQFNRKTVMDLIDTDLRIYPVGRLDYETSGLLLMTNDGDLAYRLTHPKFGVEKTYIGKVEGIPTKDEMHQFEKGLIIEGKKTAPAKITISKTEGDHAIVRIIIHEGRNRQVRKMCEEINHRVLTLKRISIGKLYLGDLKKGAYRYLNQQEIQYLKHL